MTAGWKRRAPLQTENIFVGGHLKGALFSPMRHLTMSTPSHFMFFLLRDFSHLAFPCALEPLRIANLVSGKPL